MAYEIQKPGIVNRAETLEREVSYYAVCSTAAGTAEKTVAVDTFFRLEVGAKVCVRFAYTNTASTPTLNVNGTGAYEIRYRDESGYSGYLKEYVAAGRTYDLVFDGSCWQIVGDVDTILSISDSTSSSDSTTAASSAAVKSLADLISALTSRVSELESIIGSGGFAIAPTSSQVSSLAITMYTSSGATSGYSRTGQNVFTRSSGLSNLRFSTPSGGTWAWFLSSLTRSSTGTLSSGSVTQGVAAGGTQVDSRDVPESTGNSDDSGSIDYTLILVTNICWRIS